ncbi:MAG: aminotransferase class V-fold PLP-dependent enzyme [Chitinophagales bacterium]|nr:aminotransferase class V-fold PLP-dependent enzyme [Chitinophagales bacterium]
MNTQRSLFSLPREVAYFNGAYMSPQLKKVEEAGIAGLKQKNRPFELAISDFFEPVQKLKSTYAKLINAPDPASIAIIPSVSYGIAQVANNVEAAPGDNIVLLEEQFPSNYYTWERLANEKGLELRIIKAPGTFPRAVNWNEHLLRSIDEKTAVVTMSHVHWADGTKYDLVRIGQQARAAGALFVVDGTQSVGALPFDVSSIQPDALICAGYKWLIGPYSIGLAYYSPALSEGTPVEENWINRLHSDDFRQLVNYQPAYRGGAARYSVGEQSNFIQVPMMQAAIEQLLEWSPSNIQSYCSNLLKEPLDILHKTGVLLEPAEQRAHHLIGLRLPDHIDMKRLQAAFKDHNVVVSFRGNAIRLSCHLYNDEQDVEKLLAAFSKA